MAINSSSMGTTVEGSVSPSHSIKNSLNIKISHGATPQRDQTTTHSKSHMVLQRKEESDSEENSDDMDDPIKMRRSHPGEPKFMAKVGYVSYGQVGARSPGTQVSVFGPMKQVPAGNNMGMMGMNDKGNN